MDSFNIRFFQTEPCQRCKTGSQQRAEDFVDEEDLREAEEARQLQTDESFSGFGTEHDERHRGTIMDIFHPSGEDCWC